MIALLFFAFLAGLATTLSPCILPILPIVLSGVVGGKRRPYGIIVGFVVSFAVFTLFLTVIVQALHISPDVLRYVAAAVLIILGLALLFPSISKKLNGLTNKLSSSKAVQSGQSKTGFWGGVFTGATLGLIWTPCAGPILGAVITLAATQSAGWTAFAMTLAYAMGSSLVMLLIVLGGRTLIGKIKKLNQHLGTIHRVFGALIILAGVSIAFGWDRDVQEWILTVTPQEYHERLQLFEQSSAIQGELDQLTQ